jgi:hypothetical protein
MIDFICITLFGMELVLILMVNNWVNSNIKGGTEHRDGDKNGIDSNRS